MTPAMPAAGRPARAGRRGKPARSGAFDRITAIVLAVVALLAALLSVACAAPYTAQWTWAMLSAAACVGCLMLAIESWTPPWS